MAKAKIETSIIGGTIYSKLPREMVNKIVADYMPHMPPMDLEARSFFWLSIREAYLTGREKQLGVF